MGILGPAAEREHGAASGVSQSAATLTGSTAAGASFAAHFEYGTSAAYGSATATMTVPDSSPRPGGTASDVPLSAAVSGLLAGTTYHNRLVIENSAGASYGGDETFTTAPATPAPTPPRLSGLRQTNRTWREGRAAASLAARRPPVGTAFLFSLNEPAAVTLVFEQRAGGRSSGRRCVAQTRRNRSRIPGGCRRAATWSW